MTPKLTQTQRERRGPKYEAIRRRKAAWRPYPAETEKERWTRTQAGMLRRI